MSSSKVKNISQVASAVNFTNSSSVSSAADSQIFSDIFEKTRVEDAAPQNGADEQGGQQAQQDSKASESKQAKKTDGTEASEKAEGAQSSEKAGTSEDSEAAEEVSEEEKVEIEEMENYKVSIDELAKQLNVALAAMQQARPQAQSIKIVVKGPERGDMQAALKSIDPALLRKVDIHALDEQLKKLMNGDGLVNVQVPAEKESEAPVFDQAMAAAAENLKSALEGELAAQDADEGALDEALKGVETEHSEIGADVLKKLEEINREGRVRVDFGDAMEKIEERGDNLASWQERLRGMKDNAKALNTMASNAGDDKTSQAADTFLESMRSYADKTQFDLTEIVSAKRFVFDGGAELQESFGAATPAVSKDLFLPIAAVPGRGASAGEAAAGPVNLAKTGELDARAAAKIGAKVQEIVLESAQAGKSETTRLQIHPEMLGKIDIKISMKEKMVSAEIVTDNPEAKDAILRHMPQIKAVLASENLMLDHFSARHDQGHFLAQDQHAAAFAGTDAGGGERRGADHRGIAAGPGEGIMTARTGRRHVTHDSLINITV